MSVALDLKISTTKNQKLLTWSAKEFLWRALGWEAEKPLRVLLVFEGRPGRPRRPAGSPQHCNSFEALIQFTQWWRGLLKIAAGPSRRNKVSVRVISRDG